MNLHEILMIQCAKPRPELLRVPMHPHALSSPRSTSGADMEHLTGNGSNIYSMGMIGMKWDESQRQKQFGKNSSTSTLTLNIETGFRDFSSRRPTEIKFTTNISIDLLGPKCHLRPKARHGSFVGLRDIDGGHSEPTLCRGIRGDPRDQIPASFGGLVIVRP